MAKQKGLIKLEGTIGDITFFKTATGYKAREKGGVAAGRIATDPAFVRTRENGQEFGRAGKSGKYLRGAFATLMPKDQSVIGRLVKLLMACIKEDGVNVRGMRTVQDGKPGLLEGFDFNSNAPLSAVLKAPYTAAINRVTGAMTLTVPAFIPGNLLGYPAGATHFTLSSGAAELDFESGTIIKDSDISAMLPIDNNPTAITTLTTNVTAASTLPLFLGLGIRFYQEVNGVEYPLNNGAADALTIVKVDA